MPRFGRGRSRPASGLLTGVISAKQDEWEVFWIGEGRNEPQEFLAPSLTEAADQATTAALAMYVVGPMLPDAELQFAIYPWDYGKNAPMYDISALPGQFRARDIQGSDREITAESLEGLVAALRGEPSGDKAMLRWVRPFAELPTELLDD